MKDILLITPPFTQLNTAYPATAYLKGFLNTREVGSFQMDLGIEVINEIFSARVFAEIFAMAEAADRIRTANCQRIHSLRDEYLRTLDDVMRFLQGKNPTLARQICAGNFLPMASRFETSGDIEWAFGAIGTQDKAKHMATLYLEDLSDFIVECLDANFGFSRYAEKLGASAHSFDELYDALQTEPTFIDTLTVGRLETAIAANRPKLVCISVPFPGNLYSALRCGQYIKRRHPAVKIAMGGGYPNTELRSLTEPRVFDFVDYITLDDGELPIELLVSNTLDPSPANPDHGQYKRTFVRKQGQVVYVNTSERHDYKQRDLGTPDYSDLHLHMYISVIELANPMHSLWTDGRWNKLTMAHGCYWGKCTFCDISLDYIKLYEPVAARILVDRVEQLTEQTGETGFHFVDEAAPPALMKTFALEVLRRKLTISWWTNIRFEKNFTQDLCSLLKASGCIAVSGGLEVASDRLLKLIDKGITVEQVAQVTGNFTQNGIMVHCYLMYGYPTQTIQETIDSLEMVRQLFAAGTIQSGFWHQFALTAHSPIVDKPDDYGITPHHGPITFANNEVDFTDNTGIDHAMFSFGLKKSIYNFMHDTGFDLPLQEWFDFKIPRTTVDRTFIQSCLDRDPVDMVKPSSRLVWLGNAPLVSELRKSRKGKSKSFLRLTFHAREESFEVDMDEDTGNWFLSILDDLSPTTEEPYTLARMKASYESNSGDFQRFWNSTAVNILRENGLLVL